MKPFYAQQNARLVRNAEEYYRTMFHGRVSSWNLRDSHMAETLYALDRHLATGGAPPRIAVWAHNSHLGDASATEMGERGEWNVGQLVRDRYADDACATTLRSLVALQRLQRAIGVIYRPDTERQSHYFYTRLAQQFDAVIHIDETSALEPLDEGQVWSDGEVPETFPSGV